MPKQIIIAEQHRISAVFSEDQIQELVVATGSHQVSDIYLGVVENVLQGIDAAFVNIGDPERNGFIHVSDLGPLRLKRSSGSITELLTPQQKVLVQVMKEPTGSKGPRLTGNISLPGRYLVLMPNGRGVNLSRRIRTESERNRLRALAILVKPAGMGLLVRTEAENTGEDAILEDLETLQKQWEIILQEASSTRAPALLNRDDDFIQRVLRDMYSGDVNRIVVDSPNAIKRVKQQLMIWNGGKLPQGVLIDHHRVPETATKDNRNSILEYFRINAAIRDALKPRVDLPSGGYIIIEPTEALTVIDVNSGSFTRSATARETVLWTNCEAATEIARQLRLRNIAGVIIVDFIDMDSRRDQLQVLEHFNKVLRADKARPQIAQLSELGLVELTRKRQGQNVYELFAHSCPACNGLGHIPSLPGETEWALRSVTSGLMGNVERSVASASSAIRSLSGIPVPESSFTAKGNAAVIPGPVLRDERFGEAPPRFAAGSRASRRSEIEGEGDNEGIWEGGNNDDIDLDVGADSRSLELINHPSYQELNPSHNRRRRRLDDIAFREDEPRAGRMSASAIPSELAGGMRSGSESVPFNTGREVPGRTRLTRFTGRDGENYRNLGEPPEMVSVEMPSEEQEVYAYAGISPLIFANQTVKNPRGVMVSVVAPGEGVEPSELIDEEVETNIDRFSDDDDDFSSDEEDESNDLDWRSEQILEDEFDDDDAQEEQYDTDSFVGQDENVEGYIVEEEIEEMIPVEEESAANRRRRRRSSAT